MAGLRERFRISYAFTAVFKSICGGDELKELGLRPGPDFKLILKELLDAKLDGKFSTKEEELVYLKNEILSKKLSR